MHPLKDPLAPAAKSSPSEFIVFDYDYDAAAGDGRDCGQATKYAPSKRKNFDCDYDPVGGNGHDFAEAAKSAENKSNNSTTIMMLPGRRFQGPLAVLARTTFKYSTRPLATGGLKVVFVKYLFTLSSGLRSSEFGNVAGDFFLS